MTAGFQHRVTVAWVLTRTVLVAMALFPAEAPNLADVKTFHAWSVGFWDHGVVPGRDFAWEYPHGAAPFLLLPVDGRGPWVTFALLASEVLLADALLMVFLMRRGARDGSSAGALAWLVGPLLLGPVVLSRFDMAPGALTAVALATGPVAAGALLAIAVTTKLWPAVVLLLLLVWTRRRKQVLFGASTALLASCLAAAAIGVLPATWTAVQHQWQRGVQVESLPALAPLWAGHPVVYRNGAWEVSSTLANVTAGLLGAAGLLVLLSLVAAARRCNAEQFPLLAAEAVGWLILTDRVLSPQYLLWLLPLVAVAACRPQGVAPGTLALGAASLLLTHLVYPLDYDALLRHEVLPLVLLTLRDAVLAGVVLRLHRARTATLVPADPSFRKRRLCPAP